MVRLLDLTEQMEYNIKNKLLFNVHDEGFMVFSSISQLLKREQYGKEQLQLVVDEEVVDELVLLGGRLGLDHDGEGGPVVLEKKS